MDAHAQTQGSVVAVHRVPEDRVSRYGIVEGEASSPDRPDLLRVRRLVEKPEPGRAPSDLAIAGRYILTPAIFECLAGITPGAAGEMQLTDALDLLARKESLHALAWQARRYDIGDRADYVKCFIEFALRRPETAGTVRSLAQRLLGGSGVSE
jgi:UTP--glucose-1-phosphate uridylyltransferase